MGLRYKLAPGLKSIRDKKRVRAREAGNGGWEKLSGKTIQIFGASPKPSSDSY